MRLLFSILAFALTISSAVLAQSSSATIREIATGRYPMHQDSMRNFEARYLNLLSNSELGPLDCESLNVLRIAIIVGANSGLSTNLYPEIVASPSDNCSSESPHYAYVMANAWYNLEQYAKAIDLYLQLDSNDFEIRFEYELVQMNLSAAYAGNKQNVLAIETLESLLSSKKRRMDIEGAWNAEFVNRIRINLAALYMNDRNFPSAEVHLGAIDSTLLDPYWSIIWNCNRLICSQQMLDFNHSHYVWSAYLKETKLTELPSAVHRASVQEALRTGDLTYFLVERKHLINSGLSSPLAEPDSPYAQLFDAGLQESELAMLWNQFVEWEAQFERFALVKKMDFDATQSKLDALGENLVFQLNASEEKQKSLYVLVVVLLALGLTIAGWRLWVLQRNRNQLRAVMSEPEQNTKTKAATQSPPQLDMDEVRLIGEAIAYGRRTNDAMLLLKKINLNLQRKLESRSNIDLSSNVKFNDLNKVELQVAQYILSGFPAKDIARLLKCSTQHVYNVRSKIRLKLNIDEGESIEDFLLKQLD